MRYRDYLPYQSAREYQDRKMAKWMGFFLSEHSTSLQKGEGVLSASLAYMPYQLVLTYVNQAYLQQTPITVTLDQDGFAVDQRGLITEVDDQYIGLKTEEQLVFIAYALIIRVELEEVGHRE